MQFLRNPLVIALAALSLSAGGAALAQTTVTAQATVVGTTGGTTATTPGTTTGTPAPSTQKVPRNFATDLAKASLAKQGITHPTRAQLDAERKAINAQRAQGKGWGTIAQSLGLNLGQVVSAANQARRDARKDDKDHKDHKDRKDADRSGKHGKHDGDRDRKGSEHKSGAERSGGANSGGHDGGRDGGHGGGTGGGGGKGK